VTGVQTCALPISEKQGFIEEDGGPYWKIPDDLEELRGLISHKKMMIEKYPDDEQEMIALKGLEMRERELIGKGCENQ
jgi:hypothetical protein